MGTLNLRAWHTRRVEALLQSSRTQVRVLVLALGVTLLLLWGFPGLWAGLEERSTDWVWRAASAMGTEQRLGLAGGHR